MLGVVLGLPGGHHHYHHHRPLTARERESILSLDGALGAAWGWGPGGAWLVFVGAAWNGIEAAWKALGIVWRGLGAAWMGSWGVGPVRSAQQAQK